MAELKIRPEEIRDALANFVNSYDPGVAARDEVGTVTQAGDGIARVEGLPSQDLVGGSRGFRRPGYIISAEPSAILVTKKFSLNLAVPFALKRNRTQSNSDKRRSADTGTHVQGDAAFSDYLINVGFSVRL